MSGAGEADSHESAAGVLQGGLQKRPDGGAVGYEHELVLQGRYSGCVLPGFMLIAVTVYPLCDNNVTVVPSHQDSLEWCYEQAQ